MYELRVYLPIYDLQPQFAAYLSSPTRARGYPAYVGQHSLIVEVAPALAIHKITDFALKATPDMEPGILFTERQFGLLELHSSNKEELSSAGKAILEGISCSPEDQLAPKIIYEDIIESLSDQHAVILNRSRNASMLIHGVALLIVEVTPALFACAAANEAEKEVPSLVLHDVQMMGATGRIFMSGSISEMEKAREVIKSVLENIKGNKA